MVGSVALQVFEESTVEDDAGGGWIGDIKGQAVQVGEVEFATVVRFR